MNLLLLVLLLVLLGLLLRLDEVLAGLRHVVGAVGGDRVGPLADLRVEVLHRLFELGVLDRVRADGLEGGAHLHPAVGASRVAGLRRVDGAVLQGGRIDRAGRKSEFGLRQLGIGDAREVKVAERGVERIRVGGVDVRVCDE